MSRLHFSDFEPYCATIAHADLRMRVLGFERPQYTIAHASVGRYEIQCAHEGSGQLSEGVTDRRAAGLYMQLNPRPRTVNGMAIDPDSVVFFPPGSEFCFSCDHANSWFSVRVPLDVFGAKTEVGSRVGETLDAVSVVRPAPQLVRRLRRMVPQYLDALSHAPALATSTAATEGFENAMGAIARRVGRRPVHRTSEDSRLLVSHRRQQRIASDAADIIEATLDAAHSVAGIARRLDVSQRTLLNAFHSRFGVSPRQFIQSMRLNRARQLLRSGERTQIRISDVAAECGFWDFGRFASRYKKLFGESPSQTVRG